MNLKILLLLASTFALQQSFAQKKTTEMTLSQTLNVIVSTLPDNYKKLCGKLIAGSANSYQSQVAFPGSTANRIDIYPSDDTTYLALIADNPVVFMSYVPAGNEKVKAIAKLKKYDAEIKATTILYKGKKYKVIFLKNESTTGDDPDYKYNIKDAPDELANVKFYIRLDDGFRVKTKYKCTMGVYIKK